MKINFILNSLGISGGNKVIFQLSNRLVEEGHQVSVIYPCIPPGYFTRDKRSWLNPTKILGSLKNRRDGTDGNWFNFNEKVKLMRIPSFFPKRLFKNQVSDADVTIATAWDTAYLVESLPPSKGEKYYFVQHYEIWPIWKSEECWQEAESERGEASVNMASIKPENEFLKNYKEKVDETYQMSLKNIVTSEWEERILGELNADVHSKIDIGINLEEYDSGRNVESNKLNIMAFYRGSKEKGDDEILEAYKQLSKEDRLNLVLVGEEPENLPEQVKFHNKPSDNKLAKIYSKSDIFIYPSWVEGWGMPPMEAMASRTALVSTDVGEVDNYTPQEGVEFVPIRDSEAIVEKVIELLKDENRIENMKQKNYEYIQDCARENTLYKFENVLLEGVKDV